MRELVRSIIWGTHPRYGHTFEYTMLSLVLVSVLALSVETVSGLPPAISVSLAAGNLVIVLAFTVEYLLRIWTAPKPLVYAFSFWGLVDFFAFMPFWLSIGTGTQAIRLLRLLRLMKLLRYMAGIERIRRTAEIIWKELLIFVAFAALMLVITAIGIFNFEHEAQPDVFKSIPHSLWFAVTTLTTVGYGDAYPVTLGGKFFTFLILMLGLGIVALPAGLISAAFMQAREELQQKKTSDHES